MIPFIGRHKLANVMAILVALSIVFEVFIYPYWLTNYGENYLPTNVFAVMCCLLYFIITISYIKKRSVKRLLVITTVFWLVIAMVELVFISNSQHFNNRIYLLGLLLLVPFVTYYYHQKLKEGIGYELTRDPYFFFFSGLLIFLVCSFPILTFLNILMTQPEGVALAYFHLLKVGNFILSIGYLLTAICLLRNRIYIG